VIIRWPHRDPILHCCRVDDSQLRCGDGEIGSQPEQIARPPQSLKAGRFSAEHEPMEISVGRDTLTQDTWDFSRCGENFKK